MRARAGTHTALRLVSPGSSGMSSSIKTAICGGGSSASSEKYRRPCSCWTKTHGRSGCWCTFAQQACPQGLSCHWGGFMCLRKMLHAAGRVDKFDTYSCLLAAAAHEQPESQRRHERSAALKNGSVFSNGGGAPVQTASLPCTPDEMLAQPRHPLICHSVRSGRALLQKPIHSASSGNQLKTGFLPMDEGSDSGRRMPHAVPRACDCSPHDRLGMRQCASSCRRVSSGECARLISAARCCARSEASLRAKTNPSVG